ncbi:peptide/nickel transport system permease protein [Lewinella aquimaris]|uniref:Peptide/nickel transport system permease protein n=1 Tax=Neolewinella aquimaris TaxID=1835722 RepID=A0A840EGK3_9BACT|nr:ABC transporter permease [Neolewinella aquimaris]MBB4081018.1 peptide/nickel transport system permease protein [Neolewinella aquimaris]
MAQHKLLGYLTRRLLYLPLSLLLLSVLCFVLTRLTPNDPVKQRMSIEGARSSASNPATYDRQYQRLAHELGFDLPLFYFSVTNAAVPDTLHRIVDSERRRTLRTLTQRYGNWPAVEAYYHRLLDAALLPVGVDDPLAVAARKLLVHESPKYIERQLSALSTERARPLRDAYERMQREATLYRVLYPRLYWHGSSNQYHRYLLDLLRGEFGTSYIDRRPVVDKVAVAMPRTILLNGLAILLVYLLAVPLGLYMANYHGSRFDRWATLLTFVAFGVPSFWVATLLANFFTTPAFGLNIFPSVGFGSIPVGADWFTVLKIRAGDLFLPVLCLAYPSFAYVSRHLRSAALVELHKPYVLTARMKGLAGSQVLWNHVFRNAAFPLITMLGVLLPALLAGSVVIEQIFNLPGMGLLLYSSATARDWPVVTALVLINGLLTIISLTLADVGYALLDPRVRLDKSGNP